MPYERRTNGMGARSTNSPARSTSNLRNRTNGVTQANGNTDNTVPRPNSARGSATNSRIRDTNNAESTSRQTSSSRNARAASTRFRGGGARDTGAVSTGRLQNSMSRSTSGDGPMCRSHLKRPAPVQSTRPVTRGKLAKSGHLSRSMPCTLATPMNDQTREFGTPLKSPKSASSHSMTPRNRPVTPSQSGLIRHRPGTPESVRTQEPTQSRDQTNNGVLNSPLSMAKRNAKVPQLYMSAGTTPPPSQVYRTKKRIQKRILVLSGNVQSDGGPSAAEDMDDALFRLPKAPTAEEMIALEMYSTNMCDEPLTIDQGINSPSNVFMSPSSNLSCGDENKSPNAELSLPCTLRDDVPVDKSKWQPDVATHSGMTEDIEFLLQRHRPISEAYQWLVSDHEINAENKHMSLDQVKEDIKKALTEPIGKEASLIGEMLSRETADLRGALTPSDSPPSASRRVSAPVISRSPLSTWTHSRAHHETRRVSEGSAPLTDEREPKPPPVPQDKSSLNQLDDSTVMDESCCSELSQSPHRALESSSPESTSSAPFEDLKARYSNDADDVTSHLRRLSEEFDRSRTERLSYGTCGDKSKQIQEASRRCTSRTLDEPEDCVYSKEVHKPSRRRSISEPRGRTGGPGGVVGTAIKEAYTNNYFTLNPAIFDDSRVWGISEFRKLCQMLNVDTSRCRDFQDYVALLHEWNYKPNVNIGMMNQPISSTYHAGDIRTTSLGNFHNIPILACKVPQVYRKLIDPMHEHVVLTTCLKSDAPKFPDRPTTTRLQFSPYNHNCQFYLSAEERYEKRLCLHEIASMTSISNNEEGVDAQVILLDPTRELSGDPDWECAKANMNQNLIVTNPRYHLDKIMEDNQDHSLRVNELCCPSQDWNWE